MNKRMNRLYLGLFLNIPFLGFFFLTQDILQTQNLLSLLVLQLVLPFFLKLLDNTRSGQFGKMEVMDH